MAIAIDIEKAKSIAHEIRRAARAEEFKPYDQAIAMRISNISEQNAEAARQVIRDKYATMQTAIDEAVDISGIKTALKK